MRRVYFSSVGEEKEKVGRVPAVGGCVELFGQRLTLEFGVPDLKIIVQQSTSGL